jgi:hypothetical protein
MLSRVYIKIAPAARSLCVGVNAIGVCRGGSAALVCDATPGDALNSKQCVRFASVKSSQPSISVPTERDKVGTGVSYGNETEMLKAHANTSTVHRDESATADDLHDDLTRSRTDSTLHKSDKQLKTVVSTVPSGEQRRASKL